MGKIQLLLVLISAICGITLTCRSVEPRFKFPDSDVYLKLKRSTKLQYTIMRGSETLQTVSLDDAFADGNFVATDKGTYILSGKDQQAEFELVANSGNFVLIRVSRSLTRGQTSRDCVSLEIGKLNWYGGPQNRYQYWPVERMTFSNYSYVSKEMDNCAITERYWLNSRGVFFFVEDDTPLFIDQNSKGSENLLCFSAEKRLPYDTHTASFTFTYQIGMAANAKEAHLMAVQKLLGKPSEYPNERMVRHPIWSTWALYKVDIDESIIRTFGNKIIENKFNNSQLEIDDDWEDCYGALTFRKSKFPNIKALTDDLKKQGFRVTLWIHPFINKDCVAPYNEAKSKGYLVLDHNGNPDTQWWNSKANQAAYIDFTKPDAAKWFSDRLKRLQVEDGIDSFKFDAGETSWSPPDPVLNGNGNLHPSLITSEYVRTVAKFGDLVEVRSGQRTQDLPIFLRMIDKDSEWGWNNGLPTLVTTLLQLNMAGYPFVLPDMIGGNGYNNHPPDKELFIRWLQANVFMPSLQFSYVPWNFDTETIELSLKFTKLHDDYTGEIMKRFKLATETGAPVNPPLWWIDPEDDVAKGIFDQFLLGDDIISAPVLAQNQKERDIYLPKGKWRDGNTNILHTGPKWLMSYPAPLNTLPYFIRVN